MTALNHQSAKSRYGAKAVTKTMIAAPTFGTLESTTEFPHSAAENRKQYSRDSRMRNNYSKLNQTVNVSELSEMINLKLPKEKAKPSLAAKS